MRISERAVRHPVTTILVFVTLAALGFLSSRRVGLEQFPDIGFPTAAIFTVYPGVGHNSWDNAYGQEDLGKWFLEYKKG